MKKLLPIFLVVLLIISSTTITFAGVGIDINGTKVNFNSNTGNPFVDSSNRTQVPLRVTMESYGCKVSWNQESQTAIVEKDGIKVEVPIGANYIIKNGVKIPNDTSALVKDNRTYLPIRSVLEAFGANVSWNQGTQSVVVTNSDVTATTMKVHFINVGQGDSILIDSGQFEVLIDAGPKKAASTVVNYIKPYIDGDLDIVVATHEHEDHIGGLPAVLSAYKVNKVIDNGKTADTNIYKEYTTAITSEGCSHTTATDLTVDLGNGAKYKILKMDGSYNDPNNNSVVSELEYNTTKVLFMGDAEQSVEKNNLSKFNDISVLKAGHHGSSTASSSEFLSITKPETVIVSCATGNTYKHPHLAALQRFAGIKAKVYGTEKSGNIVLTTNGNSYSLNASAQLTTSDAGDNTTINQSTAPTTNIQSKTTNTSVTQSEAAFVGNSNTKKFHKLDCRYSSSIKAENIIYFKTAAEATSAGYEPCKVCKP